MPSTGVPEDSYSVFIYNKIKSLKKKKKKKRSQKGFKSQRGWKTPMKQGL
jgi:hypothetical protein